MKAPRPSLLLITSVLALHRPRPVFGERSSMNLTSNPLQALQQFALSISSSFSSSAPANMTRRAPVVSISHGGGPLPLLGDPAHAAITKSLKTRVPQILKLGTAEQPKAIVLVTAHWSTDKPTVSNGAKPELYYDFGGFPPEAYNLKYDAPGSPEIARLVQSVLKEAGVECSMDGTRGWDHGVFVPMTLIHPAATIPILQLSVLTSESPSAHFALGRALAPLRDQNIAIIGSGFASLHNMRAMFSGAIKTSAFKRLNEEWSAQIMDAVKTEDVEERGRKFEGWRGWNGAYDMHPRGGAEHFLPLVVCAGAGGEGKGEGYADEFVGLDMWSYYWE